MPQFNSDKVRHSAIDKALSNAGVDQDLGYITPEAEAEAARDYEHWVDEGADLDRALGQVDGTDSTMRMDMDNMRKPHDGVRYASSDPYDAEMFRRTPDEVLKTSRNKTLAASLEE